MIALGVDRYDGGRGGGGGSSQEVRRSYFNESCLFAHHRYERVLIAHDMSRGDVQISYARLMYRGIDFSRKMLSRKSTY